MSIDEGYIKYVCDWDLAKIEVSTEILHQLNAYRNKLVALNMIGKIHNGPGFGNISVRTYANEFLISGTNTGHLTELQVENLSLVYQVDIKNNKVRCKGEAQASSESMSHFIIYETLKDIKAVVHVHHKLLWQRLINIEPTTDDLVEYGTPDLAYEIERMLRINTSAKTIILGGHEDGILFYGESLEIVYQLIEKEYLKLR